MPTYALLLRASANRVYGAAAPSLATAELALLDRTALGCVISRSAPEVIAGVQYVLVDTVDALCAEALAVLSNLSSLHALFEVDGDLFRPVALTPLAHADEDIVTIQRYAGKTNESFTHLLVNVALAATGDGFARLLRGERVQLLDPACGRGTTLNRAVVYGMDATGVELDERDVDAYVQFLIAWMKDKRMKHQVERARLRRGRETTARRTTVRYGPDKDRRSHRVVEVVHDDTIEVRTHLRPRGVDVLVCDLPYGVQHGARRAQGDLDRGPAALLHDALPVWLDLLRPGGAMALSWNRNTMARRVLVDLVVTAGMELTLPADEDAFAHRVDRAILRDVLVATRPTR